MRLFSINQGSSEGETPSLAEVLADEATTPTSTLESEPEAARSALDGEAPAENLDAETPFADFESEFAALEIVPVAELLPSEDAPPVNATELEEWSEPLPSIAPLVLAAETVFQAHDGVLIIEAWLEARGGENIYRASWQSAGEGESQIVRLREASGVWAERLVRETLWRTQWEKAARLAMLPRLVCGLTEGDLTYLATEVSANGPTFAEFFALKAAKPVEERAEHETVAFLSETLLLLTQVAAFLVRLHGAGFAHLGLRPDGIVSGKPVQILDCSFAAPLGEALEAPLSIAGYSAPELAHPGTVDARSDLYSVGALLYRAVTGADIPESGADFTTWAPQVVIAGVPQILRRTLGAIDTRFSSAEELHRALVKLKNRLRPALSHVVCGLSTIGLEPSRTTNQDAFGFQSGAWETENGPLVWSAFALADGMGGMAAGEVAAEVAVKTFLRAAANWSAESLGLNAARSADATQAQLVKEWASLANEAVVRAMEARGVRGGCTLDAGLVIDRRLCIAHVGDSRLYLLRQGTFEVLSRDHSFVMSLVLQGEISFEQIRAHSDRNKVTRSLGERHPQPDYFIDTLQVQKGSLALELQPGDIVLACSDGLWEPILETEMLAAIAAGDLQSAGREMLRLALQRGAPDNATLVLLRLDEGSAPVFA